MILGVILSVILCLVLCVAIIANINVKSMNNCSKNALKIVEKHFGIKKIDLGEKSIMKLNGMMKFQVEQYDIENLGNLSIMKMNMGLMQMLTFVITPIYENMPLLSADFMYILGTRKAYLEFYDVVKNKDSIYVELLSKLQNVIDKYDNLKSIEASEAWYKDLLTVTCYKGVKPKNDSEIQTLLVDSIDTYLSYAKKMPDLSVEDIAAKKAITLKYTNGLIEKGGISTNVFKKSLGDESTKVFFDNIFFGTGRY
jgi:hypothetical protein